MTPIQHGRRCGTRPAGCAGRRRTSSHQREPALRRWRKQGFVASTHARRDREPPNGPWIKPHGRCARDGRFRRSMPSRGSPESACSAGRKALRGALGAGAEGASAVSSPADGCYDVTLSCSDTPSAHVPAPAPRAVSRRCPPTESRRALPPYARRRSRARSEPIEGWSLRLVRGQRPA